MPDPKNTIMIYQQTGSVPNSETDTLIGTKTIYPAENNSWSKICSVSAGNGVKKIYCIGTDQNGNEAHRSQVKSITITGT